MTNAELSELFSTIDVDRNGMLSKSEWDSFRKIFVVKFDEFDADKDGLLSSTETTSLVNSD